MPAIDKRIDKYIEKSADFAKPILSHIRKLVHQACPDCEEKMKWSFPHFDYKGMLCSMAGFKAHCAFTFWKAELMEDRQKFREGNESAMGSLGKITSLSDLPPDEVMISYILEAMELNDNDIKLPPRPKAKTQELEAPPDLKEALAQNEAASATFDAFSPSAKKEYILWITEAKSDATRQKRLGTAIEWMAEGKKRNWKYEKC